MIICKVLNLVFLYHLKHNINKFFNLIRFINMKFINLWTNNFAKDLNMIAFF